MIDQLRALVTDIDQALDRLDKECYCVDVRDKFPHAVNPVIATVVDRSWAMHELLFLKQDLDALLVGQGTSRGRGHEDKKEHDDARGRTRT